MSSINLNLSALFPSFFFKKNSLSTSTPSSATAMSSVPSSSTEPQSFDVEKGVSENSGKSKEFNDPYELQKGVISPDQLSAFKQRKSSRRGKKLESYQRQQNILIENLLKSMDDHVEEARVVEDAAKLPIKIAVYSSLVANFSLCVLQLYAAISALSLSILATGIDSVFDIGSNVVLYIAHRQASRLDLNKWPVGGTRLETIGNVIYGSLMMSVNLVVVVESVQSIITHNNANDLKDFHIPSLVAVGCAVGVKFILFLYCYSIRGRSSQVEILWEDHRNDLFINTFALLMSAGGAKLAWWLDPLGAIIIACGVMIAWGHTIFRQFQLLAGKSAPHDFIQLIVYKAMTFSEEIEKIDTVRAYHSGPEYFVEVDVVMAGNTPLSRAHDISQKLQDKIEVLPNVGRAFVHVDHETTHTPEHRKIA